MESVPHVMALAGRGLEGDRYAIGDGSYNSKPKSIGKRQATIMHRRAFDLIGVYSFVHTRRNFLVDGEGIELAWLLGKRDEFHLNDTLVRAVGYCDPCDVPTQQAGLKRDQSFKRLYKELGGIIIEVIKGGIIEVGGPIITRDKGY